MHLSNFCIRTEYSEKPHDDAKCTHGQKKNKRHIQYESAHCQRRPCLRCAARPSHNTRATVRIKSSYQPYAALLVAALRYPEHMPVSSSLLLIWPGCHPAALPPLPAKIGKGTATAPTLQLVANSKLAPQSATDHQRHSPFLPLGQFSRLSEPHKLCVRYQKSQRTNLGHSRWCC